MLMTIFCGIIVGLISLGLLISPWPYLAPLVIFAIFGLRALYRHPDWGLLGLAALVPFEGLFRNNLLSGAKLIGISLIAILLLQLLLRQLPQTNLRGNLWRPLCLFLFCMLMSTLFTENLLFSLNNWRELLIGMTLFGITLLAGRQINPFLLCRLIALGVVATALTALFSIKHQVEGRAVGLLQDPNYFALLIAIAFPLAMLSALHARQTLTRLFWGGVSLLLLIGMVRTDSRSGLFVLILTCAIGLWQQRDKLRRLRPRHLGFVMLAIAILTPVSLMLMPPEYVARVKSIANLQSGIIASQDTSLGRRASYLVVGAQMMRDNPLLGSGPGTFPLRYAQSGYAKLFSGLEGQIDLLRRAHNTYLEIFSEMGIPAGLLFVSLLLLGLRNFERARQIWRVDERKKSDLAAHLGLSLLALSLFLMFLSLPNHKYLWLLLALSCVLRQQAEAAPAKDAIAPAAPRVAKGECFST
ncbi:MAG: O-antigen ligase family protein [Zoogloeaceae bacterium]|jgi:O-antigen ligase|nr:O-antigen ligase family protein [Zoogloeaceae bacterium]